MLHGARRHGWRGLVVAGCAIGFAATASAQPGGVSARGELGVGAMLSDYQRTSLDYGTVVAGGVRVGYAVVEPLVVQLGYFAWHAPSASGTGSQHTFEVGARVEVPVGRRLRPWLDVDVGYARTGSLGRLAISTAVGLDFDVARFLSLGPFARYGQTVAASDDFPSDARMLVGGISVTLRVSRAAAPASRPPLAPDTDGDAVSDDADVCPRTHFGARADTLRPGCPELDRDVDQVSDRDDACPAVAAGAHPELSRPGCPAPDSDGDGLLDREDACPASPVGAHPDPYRLGCPDADDDGDGMLNAIDRCRTVHSGSLPDPVTPGCPLPDRDGDTVPDRIDHCPDAAGAPSLVLERHGCAGLVRFEASELRLAQPVLFVGASDRIQPRSLPVLAAVVGALRASFWARRLSIDVHADDVGDDARSRELSERRAAAVMTWLVSHGVEPARLEAHGLGESQPLVAETTPRARATNRRVQVRLIEPSSVPAPGGARAP